MFGKSSFINRVAKNSRLEVGNKPGVTRKKQWIRVNEKIELLDTPGVLWPKFESKEVALNLSFTGTIKDEILPITEVAYELLKFLIENYRENIIERYKLTKQYIEQTLNQDQAENINIYEIMQEIGKKRGCIISGGIVDDEKTSKIILEDFRSGKIHGRAEDFAKKKEYRECFDLCVSRAVANLATLSEYCLPFVKVEGEFISYKSGDSDEEIRDAEFAVKVLGGKITDVDKFQLPGTDMGRSLVKIKKVKNTAGKYPRKAGLPSKEPLKK